MLDYLGWELLILRSKTLNPKGMTCLWPETYFQAASPLGVSCAFILHVFIEHLLCSPLSQASRMYQPPLLSLLKFNLGRQRVNTNTIKHQMLQRRVKQVEGWSGLVWPHQPSVPGRDRKKHEYSQRVHLTCPSSLIFQPPSGVWGQYVRAHWVMSNSVWPYGL